MENEIVKFVNGNLELEVSVNENRENVWLSVDQMVELFDRDKSTITRHIKNIFTEGELEREVVVAKFATTTQHGAIKEKQQTHMVEYFNLVVIIFDY